MFLQYHPLLFNLSLTTSPNTIVLVECWFSALFLTLTYSYLFLYTYSCFIPNMIIGLFYHNFYLVLFRKYDWLTFLSTCAQQIDYVFMRSNIIQDLQLRHECFFLFKVCTSCLVQKINRSTKREKRPVKIEIRVHNVSSSKNQNPVVLGCDPGCPKYMSRAGF